MDELKALPEYGEVIRRLGEVRRRWRTLMVASGACAMVAVLLGALMVYVGVEQWLRMPGLLRAVLFYSGILVAGYLTYRWVVRPSRERINDDRAAAAVEERFPQLKNGIINAVQLARAGDLPCPALAGAAIIQAASVAREVPIEKAISDRDLRRNGFAAGVTVLAFAICCALYGDAVWAALVKLYRTDRFIPSPGEYVIEKVEPGNYGVLAGGDVSIGVTVKPYEGGRPEARIFFSDEGGAERTDYLEMADRTTFLYLLRDVRKPTDYRVEIGRTQSQKYHVTVVERPAIKEIAVHVQPPAYTGLPAREEVNSSGDLRVPVGSTLTMVVTADRPVTDGFLIFNDGKRLPTALSDDKLRGLAKFDVQRSTQYTIQLKDANGHTNGDALLHSIDAIPDRPPTVKFLEPARDVTAGMGQKVHMVLQVGDDYGVKEATVRFQRNKEGVEQTHRKFDDIGGKKSARTETDLSLAPENFETGDTVYYYAEVRDHSQSARTTTFAIKVVDPGKEKEAKIETVAEALKRLEMILNWQLQAFSVAEGLAKVKPKEKQGYQGAPAETVAGSQSKIRNETVDVAKTIPANDRQIGWVKEEVQKLAANEMTLALSAAEALTKPATVGELAAKTLTDLRVNQRKIIAALRAILKVLPQVAEDVKQERQDKQGHDLPDDAKKALEGLKDKLADFGKDQKKVVDATEDLAKKPVEDLTDKDKKKIEELKTVEDKWDKFMKEAYSDLSKIPNQDFSDPRLLKELIETYEEVEMAKDALSKKAMEIAVPIEQSGAENAKELTTHIEKWLPDTPDRQKWSMEEPIGDEQSPMAELPHELEDIVGDLMEEEEDLMEEADDVTSKWSDSLDKGAGWDAMDGPISNMSAQGVTGNRLPNTSEISGRSGEGRTGKSAGEFVEEQFTGKGGRKTPTRLTPDPYQSGEVKDSSKDPAGGSTGGGKISGAGGEGLEGPVPPEIKREMERIAGRQAALRNKAEQIAINLKLMNYPSADLVKTIEKMKSLESTLKDGKYQTVSRQREVVLKGLSASKRFVEGVANIHREGASPMPRQLQDEVLDAMSGQGSVKGYEDLLKSYYEALFQEGK